MDLLLGIPYLAFLTLVMLVNKFPVSLLVIAASIASYPYWRYYRQEEHPWKMTCATFGGLLLLEVVVLWIVYYDQMRM